MSQRLEDRIKELCVKATCTPGSPEFNEVLKQLKDALRNIPTDLETRSPGSDPHRAAITKIIGNTSVRPAFGLLLCLESNKTLRLDVV
jgi:hypothetical protein